VYVARRIRGWDRGSSIVSPIDNRQPGFCRPATLQRILDIYLSEQENPDGSLKFKDRTRLNNRLNSWDDDKGNAMFLRLPIIHSGVICE
jgi:hypothetical protein